MLGVIKRKPKVENKDEGANQAGTAQPSNMAANATATKQQ